MNTSNQTPASAEFKVTLEDGLSLTVPDISKPVWFGSYYSGKLAIYAALVELEEDKSKTALDYLRNSMVYLCALTETGNVDFLTYAPYELGTPVHEICNHLLATVWNAYEDQLKESAANYHEAPPQLQ